MTNRLCPSLLIKKTCSDLGKKKKFKTPKQPQKNKISAFTPCIGVIDYNVSGCFIPVSSLINILHASRTRTSLMLCQLERGDVEEGDKHTETAAARVFTFGGYRSDYRGM